MKAKRILSALVATSMVFSMLTVSASAEEGGDPGGTIDVDITIGTVENPIVDGPNVTSETVSTNPDGTITTNTQTLTTWVGGDQPSVMIDDDATDSSSNDSSNDSTNQLYGEESVDDWTTKDTSGNITDQHGTAEGNQTITSESNAESSDDISFKPTYDGELSIDLSPDYEEQTGFHTGYVIDSDSIPDWVTSGNDSSSMNEETNELTEISFNGGIATKTITNLNTGEITTTTVTIQKDANNNIIGYEESTTASTNSAGTLPDQSQFKDPNVTTSTEYELPEKPTIDSSKNETVLDLYDNAGKLMGYVVKSSDADGNISYRNCVLGTWYTVTTKTETLPNGLTKETTTKTTCNNSTTNTISGNCSSYFAAYYYGIRGWMDLVTEGSDDGKYTMISPQPSQTLIDKTKGWDGSSENDHLGNIYDIIDSERGSTLPADGKFWYDDTGLYSNLLMNWFDEDDVNHKSPYILQFRLVDSEGNYFYAYCADMDTGAHDDSQYSITNIQNATYLSDSAKQHLQAIAENGYWGTASGSNSLEGVRSLIDESLRQDLDDGIALAATQAAIWYYAKRAEGTGFGIPDRGPDGDIIRDNTGIANTKIEDIFTQWSDEGEFNYTDLTQNEKDAAYALFSKLINLEPTSNTNTVTDIIESADIKGSKITIIDRVDNIDDITREVGEITAATGVYNTDFAFTIAVVPSQINGEVTVCVYQGVDKDNNPIMVDSLVLSIDNSTTTDGKSVTVNYDPNTGNTTYTINGIQLQESVDINLTINGTQNLNAGAYLFTSTGADSSDGVESQTLVGLVTGNSTRTVDLNVTLRFDAYYDDKPTATSTSSETELITWEASYKTYKTETPPTPPTPPITPPENPKDPEDPNPPVTPPSDPETPTPPETPEIPETPVIPETPKTPEDKNDELDDVPKTGDAGIGMNLFAAISSMSGILYLSLKKKDEE